MREQDLRRMQSILGKRGFVGLHKSHLSDRSRRLQLVHRGRPSAPSKALHAFRDCAGRDQHDLAARALQVRDFLCPTRDCRMIETAAFVRDETRAHFDDDTFGGGDRVAHATRRNDAQNSSLVSIEADTPDVDAYAGCASSQSWIA